MTVGSTCLGRLEKVELREVWATEASEFTPWLAKSENLMVLGEAIAVDLELEGQEKNVGPFRADILCKDTATGDWVLVENQLERTDHCHLGQLLTYAAGLKAVTIVWIAERFTEEHRAALDWLNEITDENFRFFGLEIELWRIGDSLVAPKFNLACKPNDWSRTVTGAAKGDLSDTQSIRLRYWEGLRTLLTSRRSVVKPTKAVPYKWMGFSVGRANFWLYAGIDSGEAWIGVYLVCGGANGIQYHQLLERQKPVIEQELGGSLDWTVEAGRKQQYIALYKTDVDPANTDDWPAQHAWLADTLDAFHRVFSPRIKRLTLDGASVIGP